ncbi:hypothetical protein C1645_803756 [Glomus cerebriforme]|uniref:SANT domain-containing protein n=1 Tax=Glomus cerebriforme TaxID=658196 RepID=A0A397T7W2_9GLOM|nr:hypothetical protein C1645_803756 [Glomus cerebriforme]
MSRENNNNNDYNYPYPLTKLNTFFLSQDQKFCQQKNIQTSRPQAYFSSPITNDDSTSSCCSISELTSSDHQCLGVEDHVSDDIPSDHDARSSPDSPTTPTNPFGINNVVNISYPWLPTTVYEISSSVPQKIYSFNSPNPSLYNLKNDLQKNQNHQDSSQEIISPLQSSPSLSTSSCMDYLEHDKEEIVDEKISFNNNDDNNVNNDNNDICDDDDDNDNNDVSKKVTCQKKSKEDIFLKFKLPVNGIATRTRSKKTIPNQDPPTTKKKLFLSEEEKVLQRYSYKVADIPQFSRKVTLPSQKSQIINSSQKNPNYPIPKTRQQILSNWSYWDQKKFLASYLSEGKNFGQLAKILNKSTKEVVEFYYYFKMSKEFRSAKIIKKDIMGYSSKLEQINDTIIKLKHLSTAGKPISSPPTTRVPPTRVTFAPSAIHKKRRGRPKKSSQVRGGGIHYYY